jgi:hypothetical protein
MCLLAHLTIGHLSFYHQVSSVVHYRLSLAFHILIFSSETTEPIRPNLDGPLYLQHYCPLSNFFTTVYASRGKATRVKLIEYLKSSEAIFNIEH